jgi:hypothetical protein
MEMPTHPEDHDAPAGHEPAPQPARRGATMVVAVVLGAVVVVVIVLHLTGVMGPAGN